MSTSSIQSEITSFSDRVDVQHAPSPQFAIGSPLPQLDGQHDIAVVHQDYQPDQGTSHLHLSRSTLKTNYALNQSKQVQSLLKNSKIADFDIVLNDGGKNATLSSALWGFMKQLLNQPFLLSAKDSKTRLWG